MSNDLNEMRNEKMQDFENDLYDREMSEGYKRMQEDLDRQQRYDELFEFEGGYVVGYKDGSGRIVDPVDKKVQEDKRGEIQITGHEPNVMCKTENNHPYLDGQKSAHDIKLVDTSTQSEPLQEMSFSQSMFQFAYSNQNSQEQPPKGHFQFVLGLDQNQKSQSQSQNQQNNEMYISIPQSDITISLQEEQELTTGINREVQTEISCVNPNIRLAIEYNTDPISVFQMIEQKQITDLQKPLINFENCKWTIPPLDFNSLMQLNEEVKNDMPKEFFQNEIATQQTKMENLAKARRRDDMKRWVELNQSCAEIIITLISTINFQQTTLEEIVKDNCELAAIIDKYNPKIKHFNEIIKRILDQSTKEDLKQINNEISLFAFQNMHQCITHNGMINYLKFKQFLEGSDYQKSFRRTMQKCRYYLNSCYSKNVQKNRRIIYEMYRIFGLVDCPIIKQHIKDSQ